MNYTNTLKPLVYSSLSDEYKIIQQPLSFNPGNFSWLISTSSTSILWNKTFLFSKDSYSERYLQNTAILSSFVFLRQSTITSFFSANLIDMPICFKKSKSLYAKTFELPLLKLTNLIMRAGLREKSIKHVSLSFSKCFTRILPNVNMGNYTHWESLYTNLINTSLYNNTFIRTHSLETSLDLHSKHTLTNSNLFFSDSLFLTKFLFYKLNEFLPLFSFYIRKVDKIPDCNINCSKPTVLREIVLPPALGPEITIIRFSCCNSKVCG